MLWLFLTLSSIQVIYVIEVIFKITWCKFLLRNLHYFPFSGISWTTINVLRKENISILIENMLKSLIENMLNINLKVFNWMTSYCTWILSTSVIVCIVNWPYAWHVPGHFIQHKLILYIGPFSPDVLTNIHSICISIC